MADTNKTVTIDFKVRTSAVGQATQAVVQDVKAVAAAGQSVTTAVDRATTSLQHFRLEGVRVTQAVDRVAAAFGKVPGSAAGLDAITKRVDVLAEGLRSAGTRAATLEKLAVVERQLQTALGRSNVTLEERIRLEGALRRVQSLQRPASAPSAPTRNPFTTGRDGTAGLDAISRRVELLGQGLTRTTTRAAALEKLAVAERQLQAAIRRGNLSLEEQIRLERQLAQVQSSVSAAKQAVEEEALTAALRRGNLSLLERIRLERQLEGVRAAAHPADVLEGGVLAKLRGESGPLAALGGFKGVATGLGIGLTIAELPRITREVFALGTAAQETGSKFQTTFGPAAAADVQHFLDAFGPLAGLNRTVAQDFAATAGAIAQGMGATKTASAELSERVLKLAGDLTSFNNIPIEESFAAIRSGLTGEQEPLKRFGIVLLDAEVKQRALTDAHKAEESQLSQLEIAQARLNLMYEKAGVALGDLERTKDSTANKTRRLGAEIDNLKIALSERAVPGFDAMASRMLALIERFDKVNTRLEKMRGLLRIVFPFARLFTDAEAPNGSAPTATPKASGTLPAVTVTGSFDDLKAQVDLIARARAAGALTPALAQQAKSLRAALETAKGLATTDERRVAIQELLNDLKGKAVAATKAETAAAKALADEVQRQADEAAKILAAAGAARQAAEEAANRQAVADFAHSRGGFTDGADAIARAGTGAGAGGRTLDRFLGADRLDPFSAQGFVTPDQLAAIGAAMDAALTKTAGLKTEVINLEAEFGDAALHSAEDFFAAIITGGENAGQVLRSLLAQLAQIASHALFNSIFGQTIGGAGGVSAATSAASTAGFAAVGTFGFATGGLVPGVGAGDTVPAMLTPGEYVLKPDVVRAIGVDRLQAMNAGATATMPGGPQHSTHTTTNRLVVELADELRASRAPSDGDVLRIIQRNPRAVRAALQG